MENTTFSLTMDAKETEFGIELETVMPLSLVETVEIGGYHEGKQVSFLPQGWKASRDCSIKPPVGMIGCEIVSPRLKGDVGIRQVVEVVQVLNQKGFAVNASCGCGRPDVILQRVRRSCRTS